MTFLLRVIPISAPQIFQKTGLTIQAHELTAAFPHSISTHAYRRDFRVISIKLPTPIKMVKFRTPISQKRMRVIKRMCSIVDSTMKSVWSQHGYLVIKYNFHKASKTERLDLCQRQLCLAMRQGGILFCILELIAHFIMLRQVFLNVFVLFGSCE